MPNDDMRKFDVGAMQALLTISACLLGEIALIKASINQEKPNIYIEQFLAVINSVMPEALASLEQVSPASSEGYEREVEQFSVLIRETVCFS